MIKVWLVIGIALIGLSVIITLALCRAAGLADMREEENEKKL